MSQEFRTHSNGTRYPITKAAARRGAKQQYASYAEAVGALGLNGMKERLDFWEGQWWEDYKKSQEYQKQKEYAEAARMTNIMVRDRQSQIGEVMQTLGYGWGVTRPDKSSTTAFFEITLTKNRKTYNGVAMFEAGHLKTILKAKQSGLGKPVNYLTNGQPSKGTETIYPIYLGSFGSD